MLEQPAVAQAGQRVVVGEVAQVLLQALALGDVLELGDVVQRRAVAVAHERHRQDRRDDLAGGVEVALLHLEGGDLARRAGAGAARGRCSTSSGMHDAVEALADQLLRGVAGDVAQRAVDEQPAPVAVEQRRADRRALEDLLEVAAAEPRREQVGVPARGDVEHDRHAARDAALAARLVRAGPGRLRAAGRRRPSGSGAPSGVHTSRERVSPSSAERNSGSSGVHTPPGSASPTSSPSRARARVAEPLERVAGREHEAQLAVEHHDQRLGQLAQRGRAA